MIEEITVLIVAGRVERAAQGEIADAVHLIEREREDVRVPRQVRQIGGRRRSRAEGQRHDQQRRRGKVGPAKHRSLPKRDRVG